jgi:hypothetical protein
LDHLSEEPACRGGVLPDAASGHPEYSGLVPRASGARNCHAVPRRSGAKSGVQGGYGTCFCSHGTSFIALRCDRGTMFLSGRKVLPVQKFDRWAQSQCRGTKLSRRQKLVKVQDFNCVQMRVSGCNVILDLSW